MHDKNGKPIKKGDRVRIEGVIENTAATEEFCNITVGIGREQEHGAFNIHGTVVLNAKQVEVIDEI